ncbi:MAG: M23 family metallopeptidase [Gemmatimonadota bacterium]
MKSNGLATFASVVVLLGLTGISLPAQLPPFVEFRVPKAPTVALVGDSTGSLAYEILVTNLTAAPLTLRRVEVVRTSDGRVLHAVEDTALARDLARPGANVPMAERTRIGPGLRAQVFVWVPVDPRSPPASVRQRLTFQRAAPDTALVVLEGATVPVEREVTLIGPPLRGEWVAVNGPSNQSGHRRSTVALNGLTTVPQRYGIDFLQVDAQSNSFRNDRSVNANFLAQGTEILSVGDGVVVATRDSIPENVPGGRAVPITLETVGGNYIVIDLGRSRFAFFAHVQPGSLRVKVGDRVRRGQVIALLGNSGNSTEPHLHFHMTDALASGTTTLGSEGIPWAVEGLQVTGRCAVTTAFNCTRTTPVTLRRAMPMQNQLVKFPGE